MSIRNCFIIVIGVISMMGCSTQISRTNQPKPNILLIVSEDNGPDLGCYGNEFVHTPVLDSLAASGVKFENAYVTYSVCSPSRSTLFTGLYPHQNGQIGLATHKYRMHQDFKTLPEYLQEAGYRTACLGKIHVNPESAIPFDYWDIRGANFSKKQLHRYAQKGQAFAMESQEPFFLMVNFPDAHFPVQKQVEGLPTQIIEPDEIESSLPFVGVTSERLKEYTANYYNCMNRLDESVGMLMDSLQSIGVLDNTVVIYMGDHGAQFSRGKCSNYEGALKVPMIISWPDHISRSQVKKELISSVDILPTILDIAGMDQQEDLPGFSFLPLCLDDDIYKQREFLFADGAGAAPFMFFPRRSVRGERFKLIHNLVPRENPHVSFYESHKGHFAGGTSKQTIAQADSLWKSVYNTWQYPGEYELYDLKVDPLETKNLANEPHFMNEFTSLRKALENWQVATSDPFRDKHKLKMLIHEMDSVAQDYPALHYRKDKEFEWQYPDYLYN